MPATASEDQIEARIVEALVSFGAERESISREAGWESLDLVEMAQIVEDEYGVQMREEDMTDLRTVGEAIDFVVGRA